MRRLLFLSLAAWLAMAPAPAAASVTVFADIFKEKDILILELIQKVKTVSIDVIVDLTGDKGAESQALINQTNQRNEACENCAEKRDIITDSVHNNSGLVSVNQAAGNMNNQGNAVAVAFDLPPGPAPPPGTGGGTGFAEAQASVEQKNGWVFDTEGNGGNSIFSVQILFREALIENSVNDNTGIVHVNQSAGNMNNQANALSLAVSLAGGVALSEADLGQFNAFNVVNEFDVFKTATITGSVQRNTGIIGVNQASGNMANQANVVSVAAAVKP